MKFLDKQINETRNNYNYFYIKLIFSILKNIFKLSLILLLSSIFNYTIINIIAIICTIYYFYNIISITIYYFDIINDIRDTLNYEELYFEFDFNILNNDMFRSVIKYEK